MTSSLKDLLELGWVFHGHKCPAMPLGLRAGLAAMSALGVERAKAHELHILAETGNDHAGGCFLDGLMVATGCTYGKSNIEKLYYNKFAFTLIDVETNRAVRVSLKPEFVEKMLKSPFVQLRKQGKKPQDIPQDVLAPLLERVLNMPEAEFLTISDVFNANFKRKKSAFEAQKCDVCGEMTFINKLTQQNGKNICQACLQKQQ